METRVSCVVPARLGSTRFPGKLLQPLFGKPVVAHALERAAGAGCFDRIICLTDSPEIGAAAAAHGFDWALTGEAANGTERIARNLGALAADLIVNLQGDEPAFPEEGLRILCAALRRNPEWVHTLAHADPPPDADVENPNRVKAALDADGFVTGFFRRAPAGLDAARCRLQLGAYGYSRGYLARYAALPPSADEVSLSHELLRAPGLARIRAHASRPGASVDVPEDLITARHALEAALSTPITSPQPSLQGVPA